MRYPCSWRHLGVTMLCSALLSLPACGDSGGRDSESESTASTASTTQAPPTTSDGTDATVTEGTATGSTTAGPATDTATTQTTDPTTDTTDTTASTTGEPWEPTPGALCDPVPSCEAPLPGDPNIPEALNHRGRDMFYVEGDEQWVMAKFAEAGVFDFDLENEPVQLWLLRGCEGEWEYLGMTSTTDDGDHPTIEGVEDTGGRLYFKIPDDMLLEPGRHRIHMVLVDDNSRADQYIDVVPQGAPMFISDVDGTLTTAEFEELIDFLLDEIPDANPFAAEALTILANKGYRPMYLTARPEFLGKRTREFVEARGFPHGIIHTSLSKDGALGSEAVELKTNELAMLAAKGLVPTYVFGNSDSDAEAYDNADIQPLDHRIFFQHADALGGRTINSYADLLDEFEALPDLCNPP